MKSKISLVGAFMALTFVLAGCGASKLTTTKSMYHASGMVATIKGSTNSNAKVTYRVDDQKSKKAQVHTGEFVFNVAPTDKTQSVKIESNNNGKTTNKTVKVAAAKQLGSYPAIAKQYNAAVVASTLPKETQQDLQAAQKLQQQQKTQSATQMSPEQAQQMQAQAAKAQAAAKAYSDAEAKNKDKLFPTSVTKNGVQQIYKQSDFKVRMNVDDNNVYGATLIVPTKSFKHKDSQKQFGTTLALLSNAVGADAKDVMKQFSKELKNQKDGQTTIKTIKSKGVKFDIGVSTKDIYIYITK